MDESPRGTHPTPGCAASRATKDHIAFIRGDKGILVAFFSIDDGTEILCVLEYAFKPAGSVDVGFSQSFLTAAHVVNSAVCGDGGIVLIKYVRIYGRPKHQRI